MKIFLLSLVSLLFLAGCSTTQQDESSLTIEDVLRQSTGQNGRACLRIADIKGFGFDKRTFTVDGRRSYYLGTTRLYCDADTSPRAVFDGPGGEFCGGGTSRIVTASGSCSIRSLFEFESREQAFAARDAAIAAVKGDADAAQEQPEQPAEE
ncbi:hypothetical protein SAMN02745866_00803 [Alteromonadaceae bacterium Bs31]|nr:hypothetical protein SAMN02745866_00803 [Alteromonadaceae bacterium Bs31]